MKKLILILLICGIFLIPQASASYYIDYYFMNTTDAQTYAGDIPSFYAQDATCSIADINSRVTLTGTNFDLVYNYYSPNKTTAGIGALNNQNSFSNKDFGTINMQLGTTGAYEGGFDLTSFDSPAGWFKLKGHFGCNSTVGNFTIIHINRSSIFKDDKGNYFNTYTQKFTLPNTTNTSIQYYIDYNESFNATPYSGNVLNLSQEDGANYLIVPFNSSESADVRIEINLSNNSITSNEGINEPHQAFYIEIVEYSTLDIDIIYSNITLGAKDNLNLVFINQSLIGLNINSLYFLVLRARITGAAKTNAEISMQMPDIKIIIDSRTGDFECTDWTTCVNGTQTRTCTDASGTFPNKFEFQSCFEEGVYGEQLLGFENETTQDILECKKDPWSCVSTPQSITLDIPGSPWVMVFQEVNDSNVLKKVRRFGYLTSEESTEGFKSLKMIYNPPNYDWVFPDPVDPSANPAYCNNSSSGAFPNTLINLSDQVFTELTFPSNYTAISWDVKKQLTAEVQYDLGWLSYCPDPKKLCFGDCNATPGGRYGLNVIDVNNSNTIYSYSGEASDNWSTVLIDLSPLNLQPNILYRLSFAVNPFDQYDPDGHIVYFDNVKVISLTQPLNQTTNCEDYCNGTDLYEAIYLNGVCTFEIDYDNEDCILNISENSTEPISYIDDLLDDLGVEEAGLGFTKSFFSPMFLGIIIVVLIGFILEYYVAKAGGSGHGLIFGIFFLVGTASLTIFGIFPIGYAVILLIISGVAVVSIFMKAFGGN